MSGELRDNAPLELSDLINRVLDKGAVIAGSVTISGRRHRSHPARSHRRAHRDRDGTERRTPSA